MSHIYLISDTHFNHKNIIAYENRPFQSVAEMNSALIHNWNQIIHPDDTVIHLGDVGLGSETMLKIIVPALNGHKILIMGNHDTKSKSFYHDCGFEEAVHTKMLTYHGYCIYLSHRPESRPGDGQKYDLHFYGHIHDKFADTMPTVARNGACLCVERWDYKPVDIDEVIELCKNASITCELI